jgi:hypothetical protein
MGGPAPQWVQIFPSPSYVGELDGEKKTWITDEVSQQSCVDYFRLRGNDLVFDYEHLSDTDGEAPAAGRIVELRAGGAAGLLARVEWTERARRQIEAGEYYYDSPSFFWSRKDDRIYGLRHVALTNNPGSWNRPYITDHSAADYGMERASQRGASRSLQLVCAVSNNKGGRRGVPSNVLDSLRSTIGRKANVTARELRADLLKLADLVPDTDERIFLADGAEIAEAEANTIAHLIGREQFGAAEAAETPKAGDEAGAEGAAQTADVASQSADLTPIALALGVESSDPKSLALAVMNLKASTVSVESVRDLEKRLAEAETRTSEERIVLEVTRQRAAGKQITPAFEADLIRVAKQDLGLAMSSLAGLQVTSVDLATQSDAPAPTVERLETARQRATQRTERLPTDASAALKASTTAHEETLAIANEKGLTYPEANKLRLESRAA